jgi:hypothetical protein
MRAPILLAAASVCATALAFAQEHEGAPAEPVAEAVNAGFHPDWEQRPVGRTYAQYYPRGAITTGVSGYVALCCIPLDDGHVSCGVAVEEPQRRGFGQAAVNVVQEFRMSQESVQRFRADPNNWMQISTVWRVAHRNRGPDVEALAEQHRSVCEGVSLQGP